MYLGCYSTISTDKTLRYTQNTQLDNTPSFCSDKCVAVKSTYIYSGVERGDICWCDDQAPDETKRVEEEECSKPCEGDSTQVCGNTDRMNIYQKSKSLFTFLMRIATNSNTYRCECALHHSVSDRELAGAVQRCLRIRRRCVLHTVPAKTKTSDEGRSRRVCY